MGSGTKARKNSTMTTEYSTQKVTNLNTSSIPPYRTWREAALLILQKRILWLHPNIAVKRIYTTNSRN